MYRRLYDCVLHDGDVDPLIDRILARQHVVDVVVVVESTRTPAGAAKPLALREEWAAVRPYARDLRYIVVDGGNEDGTTPLIDYALRGLRDLQAGDRVCLGRPEDEFAAELLLGGRAPSELCRESSELVPDPPTDLSSRLRRLRRRVSSRSRESTKDRSPVILCPYLEEEDLRAVERNWRLDLPENARVPVFFWQDTQRIGPERAFEHCWSQVPDRDVIIVHTDMWPMPGHSLGEWYDAMVGYADALPDAAMFASDLVYPEPAPDGYVVQCAGGYYREGRYGYVGGRSDDAGIIHDGRFAGVRSAGWLTFGGVYLRRETIDMIGSFDRRYKWAYVMDVDYSLEAIVRGLRLYQVPLTLVHAESVSTKPFLAQQKYLAKVTKNQQQFQSKWGWYLQSLDKQPYADCLNACNVAGG